MAANKFATMVHRRTNRVTLILVYAFLEWALIIFLLLNSLFSYLIIKFADYFGLERPCLLCSRLDRFFEPTDGKSSFRDLLCELHASEISKLGYCSNHRKLAESQDMCEDCSSSSRPERKELSGKFAFFPWMKQIGMIQGGGHDEIEDGEIHVKCSCCGVTEESKIYSPCVLIKPSWGVLDYTQKGNLIIEEDGDDENNHVDLSNQRSSELVSDDSVDEGKGENKTVSDVDDGLRIRENEVEENFSVSDSKHMVSSENEKVDIFVEKEKDPIKDDDVKAPKDDPCGGDKDLVQPDCGEGKSAEVPQNHLEFLVDRADYRLIPVELIDAAMAKDGSQCRYKEDNQDFVLDFDSHDDKKVETIVEKRQNFEERVPLLSIPESEEEDKVAVESMKFQEEESSSVFHAGDKQVAAETSATDVDDTGAPEGKEDYVLLETEDFSEMRNDDSDAEVSIGTEIPDQEHIDDIEAQEIPPLDQCLPEDLPATASSPQVEDDPGSKQTEEEIVEFKTLKVETREPALEFNVSLGSESNEVEEKAPDTPSSLDSLHHLHKKWPLLERRESGAEESLDGSVVSDIESGDGVLTVEKLKSALKAERKALNALYAELEEERSASAVAASQTMAMINRLQEEKAAMQMEASQYQRMMEEQAEYDQEALQLLNELMVKREKEKQELETELEIYRKKLQEYEAKEKIVMIGSKENGVRSRNASASCSNAEDSDGISVDLSDEAKEDEMFEFHHENGNHHTPTDAVLCLEDSLADFEEERLSILEQLKYLEEKLLMLSDEEDNFEIAKPAKHVHELNGNGYDEHFDCSSVVNGCGNGHFKEMNGKQQDTKILNSKAKRLLPLFDATETENGHINGDHYEEGDEVVSPKKSSVTKIEAQNKTLAVEEEVDLVYERLQALEADREFLKHCVSSLRKGDKGLYLLQEILQHLRDLKSVEMRARTIWDTTA